MSTRGCFGFLKNGEYKVMYNHWDSYYSGLGNKLLDFLHHHRISTLNKMFDSIVLVHKEIPPTPAQKKKCIRYGAADFSVDDRREDNWYCLLRNCQGDLNKIKKLNLMLDGKNSLKDVAFTYIIDLDKNQLRVSSYNSELATISFPLNKLPRTFDEENI